MPFIGRHASDIASPIRVCGVLGAVLLSFNCDFAMQRRDAGTVPSIALNNGVLLPMISQGFWLVEPKRAAAVLTKAWSIGYRHFDESIDYCNQVEVGRALYKIPRNRFFLLSKVDPGPISDGANGCRQHDPVIYWRADVMYNETAKQLAHLLKVLRVAYLDVVLVHYPPRVGGCAEIREQWRALEDYYEAGFARAIGVSSFGRLHLDCLLQTARIVPMVNQVKLDISFSLNKGMLERMWDLKRYCNQKGIVMQAFSPLRFGVAALQQDLDKLLAPIAKSHKRSQAEIALRWLIQNDIPFAQSSTSVTHLRQNLGVFSWRLTQDDMEHLGDFDSWQKNVHGRRQV